MKPARAYPEKNRRGFAPILIVLVLGLLVSTVLGYLFIKSRVHPIDYNAEVITNKDVENLNSPFPSPSDETANWKTYRNTKYGYSIKYPQNFVVEEHEGIEYESTQFISNDIIYPQGDYQQIIKGGVITVTVSQTGDSLSYLVEQYRRNDHFSQFQPVSLGGLEAWKFAYEMLPGYGFEPKIITVKSGKQYWVTAGFAKEDNEKIIKIFNQSLSTFRFE